MTGFEPATSGSTIRRSNQLSYTHHTEKTLDTGPGTEEILTKTEEAPQPMEESWVIRRWGGIPSSPPGIKGRLHFRKN